MVGTCYKLRLASILAVFLAATLIEAFGLGTPPGESGTGFTLLNGEEDCLPPDDTVIISTAPTSPAGLGNLPAPSTSGGSVGVLSNTIGNWKVAVYGTDDGHMKHETMSYTLGQPLKVTGTTTINLDGSSNPQTIFSGSGISTGCIESSQAIYYTQHVNSADNAYPGKYTIIITYAASKVT